MNHKISVLLADDHPMFRKGLRVMLEEEGITVLDEAGGGEEAIEKAIALTPDVVVMDISMPDMDGIEATRRILKAVPSMKVLPLSIHSGKRFVEKMLRAGACGYVLKESAPEDLLEAIHKVHGGDVFLSPGVSGVVLSEYMRLLNQPGAGGGDGGLSEDEEAVLRLIGEGYAVQEISVALDKSASAVQAVRRCLVKKLGLGSVTELAEYAAAERWAKGESQVEISAVGGEHPVAAQPILANKFHPIGLPDKYVSRKGLVERLKSAPNTAVTLISAPAGYGKSTLIAEWTATDERPAAWLHLDEADNNPRVFLRYVVAAVQSLFPEACGEIASLLQAANLPSIRVLASHLANDLAEIETPFTLTLDNYHEIRDPKIQELMTELLRHPPANVHWIIGTRHDPPLPLASLRANGRLHEIRFDDLRFTFQEAGELMASILRRPLSDLALDRVAEATEGWAAGLQLLALACRHQPDPEAFVMGLQGNILGIQDYLIAEVLSRETPEFRRCILRTSVVDRFNAGFCEGVCEKCKECTLAGAGMMQGLADSETFLIPLDPQGDWFRYHNLFRDLLRRQLETEFTPAEIADLHSSASRWFEDLGLMDRAISHALKAGDPVHAAEIVETRLHEELNADRWQTIERWLQQIPGDIQQQHPKLLLGAAYVAIERSQIGELPALVEQIEILVDENAAEPEVLGALNLLRGEIHYWQGEPARARELLFEARGQIPPSQYFVSGENELHIALALQALGRSEEARAGLAECARNAAKAGPVYHSRLAGGQVFVDMLAGELSAAAEGARRLESLGRQSGITYIELWGAYMETLARFHWNEMDAVVRSFSDLAEKIYLMNSRMAVDSLSILALGATATGQTAVSASAIRKLRKFAEESGNPELLNVAGSCEARLAVSRGDFDSADRWLRSFREPLDFSTMFFWGVNPWITECRVLTARGSDAELRQAETKLAELRKGLSQSHNASQLIEVIVLTALTLEKQGRSSQALVALGEALAMAEPGGWIRPFVELGGPMKEILGRLEPNEQTVDLVQRIDAAFTTGSSGTKSQAARPAAPPQPLIEPLTNREIDVLELIAERLYDKEIAERLSISQGTVKTHLKHLYGKLAVGNRRHAVDRAEELGILGKPR